MATETREMTAEGLLKLPADGFRYELAKGELRKISPAGGKQGIIAMRLGAALSRFVEENGLGEVFGAETGFKLASDPDTVRAPDAAFVREERIPPGNFAEGFWPLAPDLAVEVVSPGDTLYEVDEKVEDYLAAGVRAVWIVNPKRHAVTVYRLQSEPQTLTEEETLDGQDVVPGFQYNIARLFARKR